MKTVFVAGLFAGLLALTMVPAASAEADIGDLVTPVIRPVCIPAQDVETRPMTVYQPPVGTPGRTVTVYPFWVSTPVGTFGYGGTSQTVPPVTILPGKYHYVPGVQVIETSPICVDVSSTVERLVESVNL